MTDEELRYLRNILRYIADHDQDARIFKPDEAFVREICDYAHRILGEPPFNGELPKFLAPEDSYDTGSHTEIKNPLDRESELLREIERLRTMTVTLTANLTNLIYEWGNRGGTTSLAAWNERMRAAINSAKQALAAAPSREE
jgi:hypothetical protein